MRLFLNHQVLPVGKELLACLVALKEFIYSIQGRTALLSICSEFQASVLKEHGADEKDVDINIPDECHWRQSPPFFCCWKKLLRSLDSKDNSSTYIIEAVHALALSAMSLCTENERYVHFW